MITVFTPSYNRKNELKCLYESLLEQDNCDFEWLIVDDGSSDGTDKFINILKKQKKIKINYIYKENGGKQSAYNIGLSNAKGNIFLCIDSDDILSKNSLKLIAKDFDYIMAKKDVAGMMYVQGFINDNSKVIGSTFPQKNMLDTYFNIYHKHGVMGDKLIVLKTEVAREYYFPIIENEKFVPEALIFNRISLKYKFKCSNKIMAYKEYLADGYSNNYFNLVKKNPKGNMLYFKELYVLEKSIYNIYGYILFGIYGKIKFKDIIKGHSAKLMIILLYIPVWFISKLRR